VTELSKIINTAVESGISPPLRSKGFRKVSTHFFKTEDVVTRVVNVQSSKWNSSQEARFTINLGLYFPAIAESLDLPRMPAHPKEYCCILRTRIGALLPVQKDFWWEVASNTNANELSKELNEVLTRYGLPWLEQNSELVKAADELERKQYYLAASAARLELGQRDKAATLARTALKTLSNRFAVQRVEKWCLKHSLEV
jgi:hypothetical protein